MTLRGISVWETAVACAESEKRYAGHVVERMIAREGCEFRFMETA